MKKNNAHRRRDSPSRERLVSPCEPPFRENRGESVRCAVTFSSRLSGPMGSEERGTDREAILEFSPSQLLYSSLLSLLLPTSSEKNDLSKLRNKIHRSSEREGWLLGNLWGEKISAREKQTLLTISSPFSSPFSHYFFWVLCVSVFRRDILEELSRSFNEQGMFSCSRLDS